MAEKLGLETLEFRDKISVLFYRWGIIISGLLMLGASMSMLIYEQQRWTSPLSGLFILGLYLFTGISVFNIHLYMGSLKRFLKGMYIFAAGLFLILFYVGGGHPFLPLMTMPVTSLLLLPLFCCLAFIGAKEGYCFNLIEGYILAFLLPSYVLLWSIAGEEIKIYGLMGCSVLMLFLGLRKAVMPLSFDVGDKTKYIP
ncbi:MAG: DUF2301 domain-containing membrane protein [Thermodesulfovibrionales bacterium]|nr:DUF2301 domain-containing membrane protein [Thermodesulfovibrionales bacterium]